MTLILNRRLLEYCYHFQWWQHSKSCGYSSYSIYGWIKISTGSSSSTRRQVWKVKPCRIHRLNYAGFAILLILCLTEKL